MSLLKWTEVVFERFGSRIFSNLRESEQSEQSSYDVKLNSFDYDTHN